MISAQLSHSKRYENLLPGLDKAFAWLRENAANPPADGRYPIESDNVFAIVVSYSTAPRTEKILETHRNYLDVQFLAKGGPEAIYFTPADRAPLSGDYDPAKDLQKYEPLSADSLVVLKEGDFAIFFPEDAHQPGVHFGRAAQVKKIVVKVRVE